MDTLTEKKLAVFEQWVDMNCEFEGVNETIRRLLLDGFTPEELEEMNFNKEDINAVILGDAE